MTENTEKPLPLTGRRWILPILLLPMNALVFIPALTLYLTGYRREAGHPLCLAAGCLLLLAGMGLAAWTMRLFHAIGRGTAAPWDPPRHLVVAGPYRHVRNPMLTSVFAMQAAEALLLNSWAIFILLVVFVVANLLYFPLVEEKNLEKRFGDAYRKYRRNVPRWIPRLRPWSEGAAAQKTPG
ncbi:MAG: isoprenylcysteine carboxylmethyltransferase family protein [Deltaproteobacteria bacterium]|jgi:protein-S-isoprenylcysteine O-methyltransferase Ste14|nr:isoprenylcysteine carboxylmethyltransferase family protein [Deltaproteobacteria bacterium]